MQRTQLVGLLLWRVGLIVAGGWAGFEVARSLLRFVDFPAQIEIGLGLGFVGFAFVMLSLILERIADRRLEGDLSDGGPSQ